jgi:hypothetical protein
MKIYKVVHQHCDRLVVEAEFNSYPEAAVSLANSIYMDPFIVIADDDMNFDTITPDEARKFAVERIEFRHEAAEK